MIGSVSSGNPNILKDLEGKRTGPKSSGAKARVSMNASKYLDQSKKLDKAMVELGIKFEKAGEALTIKKAFKEWFLSKTGKELTEIDRLSEIINILETDVAVRTMGKLDKGLPLDSEDVKLIKLLKDTLETSHRLKFGDKHFHAHASYKDIREMMFEDVNPRSE